MAVPVATYRLQFNQHFRFEDARVLVSYLQQLGITDLYASPLFKARQGSPHGYDITDPLSLNPELGTAGEFELLVQEIKHYGMRLLLDIVPNHMAISPENPWWMDVLENGPSSPYAPYFDIDWRPAKKALEHKVLLPILGAPFGSVLENRELTLTLEESGFVFHYYEVKLPLEPKSYRTILAYRLRTLEEAIGTGHPAFHELVGLIEAIEALPVYTATDPEKVEERRRAKGAVKYRLWSLYNAFPEIKTFLDENVKIFNGIKGDPSSFDLLDKLLTDQPYRLAFWRKATEEINYRRFFDISDLIGIQVENPPVFEATHDLIFKLVEEGTVMGLRADHIDGLYDPLGYLRRLQSRIAPGAQEQGGSPGFYVIVEKILIGDEALPEEWPVCGTTGYDFLNVVNGVFVDTRGMKTLDTLYVRFTGSEGAFTDVVYERKKQVMEELFAGEVRALGEDLGFLAGQDRHALDIPLKDLMQALVEVTACFPVYRSYILGFEVPPQDRSYIERAVEEAKRRNPALDPSPFEFLRRLLLLDFPSSLAAGQKEAWLRFVRRWQQFTGPVMAKGLEDTALYVYNRLISLNEVGGDPGDRGLSVEAFHRCNLARRAHWPFTLNATSTHDTKRSEDIRARINVLSELPETWTRCLSRWKRWNQAKKHLVDGLLVPDPNEEILLYQTLIGAWPLSEEEVPAFKKRLSTYMIKAAREAKVHTSWIRPDEVHERALIRFVDTLLDASSANRFLEDFRQFQGRIAFYGAFNALAQVLLKIASPGVPDFYQGMELWDFSLVDPDNRRPVDFQKRMRYLEDLKRREATGLLALTRELLSHWEDGRMKLFLTSKALDFRRTHKELFLEGDYIPLYGSGRRKEHACAFARRKDHAWALVVVPRLLTKLVARGALPLGRRVGGGSSLILPSEAPERWLNVLTGEVLKASPASQGQGRMLHLHDVFHSFPVALLSGTSA